jgi:hypothetical protein
MTRDQVDILLRDVVLGEEEALDTTEVRDAIADFIHESTYGVPAPGAKAAPKNISEIAEALDNVRKAVRGENPFAAKLKKLNFPLSEMAERAAQFAGSDSITADFLRGAADGDDAAMRAAIRRALEGPTVN